MQVKDAMTTDVELASPTQTIRQAALLMGKTDCGALPVADKDSLVGMITDRDIARTANGTDPAADALKAISEPGGEHSQSTAH